MNQDNVLPVIAPLRLHHPAADGALAVLPSGYHPVQLVNPVLPGVGLQNVVPAVHADNADPVDVRVGLEGLQRVDDDRLVVHVQELLGDLVLHPLAAAAGDNQPDIHTAISSMFRRKCFSSRSTMASGVS